MGLLKKMPVPLELIFVPFADSGSNIAQGDYSKG